MSRKKIALVVLLALVGGMAVPLFAQEEEAAASFPKNEIYAGYGTPSYLSVIMLFVGALTSISDNTVTANIIGPAQFGYNYYFNDHWSLGLFSTLEYQTYDSASSANYTHFLVGSAQLRPDFQWGWERVKIYHGLSVGAACVYSEQNSSSGKTGSVSWIPIFDLIPLGVKVKVFGGLNLYAECGFGSTGYVNGGVSFRY